MTWVKSVGVEDLQNQIAKSRLRRRLSTIKNNERTLPITFLNSSTYPTPYDRHEITQSLIFFVEKKKKKKKKRKTHSRKKESMTSITSTLG